jgi:tetratricopeptide (TPR) repeat protein
MDPHRGRRGGLGRRLAVLAAIASLGVAFGGRPRTAGADAPTDVPPPAAAAVEARDWSAAAAALAPLAADGTNRPALYWLGLAKVRLGDPAAAVAPLTKALALDPRDRPCAVLLAACGEALDDWSRAEVTQPAYEAFPADAEVLELCGRAWFARYVRLAAQASQAGPVEDRLRAGYLRGALRRLRDSVAIDDERVDARRYLAYALEVDGEPTLALEHVRAAKRMGATGYEVFVVEGKCLAHLGHASEALAAFDAAETAAPARFAKIRAERAHSLYELGRFVESADAYHAALAADPLLPFARHEMGEAAFAAGDFARALWAFGQSDLIDHMQRDVYMAARSAYALEKDALAESLLDRLVGDGSDARPAWRHWRGRARWAQGKRKEALEDLAAAEAGAPQDEGFARWHFQARVAADDPRGALNACRLHGNAGGLEAAEEGVAYVVGHWPSATQADVLAGYLDYAGFADQTLAEIRFNAGAWRSALRSFERLGATSGARTTASAGWCLAHAGRAADAEALFREAAGHGRSPDANRQGLAYVLLASGRAKEAAEVAAKIRAPSLAADAATVAALAKVATGPADDATTADPYALLGLFTWASGPNDGIRVYGVAPQGALARATPKVQAGDWVQWVGDQPLGTSEGLAALRALPMPKAPVDVFVRRDGQRFRARVDFAATLQALRAGGGR